MIETLAFIGITIFVTFLVGSRMKAWHFTQDGPRLFTLEGRPATQAELDKLSAQMNLVTLAWLLVIVGSVVWIVAFLGLGWWR